MNHTLSLEVPETLIKICEYKLCNKKFIYISTRQKYCSVKCAHAERKAIKRGFYSKIGQSFNCKGCEKSFIKSKGNQVYCTIECSKIHLAKEYYQNNKEKWTSPDNRIRILKNHPYKKYKKDICEECGFVPIHLGQLDVDHIDGNHKNNNPFNLRTLCANCHRLKTILNKDGIFNRNNSELRYAT